MRAPSQDGSGRSPLCGQLSAALRLTERDWQARVIDTAKLFGWRYAHFRPARTRTGWVTAMEGHKGFPDLVLLKPPRIIFAELKIHSQSHVAGRPSPDQIVWLAWLQEAPCVEVYIWCPSDWQDVYTTLAKDSTAMNRSD